MIFENTSEKIIKCAFKVHNYLGSGYLEAIYHKCMEIECKKENLKSDSQKQLAVYYDNQIVGSFIPDLVINNNVIVEFKAVSQITDLHKAQLINYLKCTKIRVGLILNFGSSSLGIKRMIL